MAVHTNNTCSRNGFCKYFPNHFVRPLFFPGIFYSMLSLYYFFRINSEKIERLALHVSPMPINFALEMQGKTFSKCRTLNRLLVTICENCEDLKIHGREQNTHWAHFKVSQKSNTIFCCQFSGKHENLTTSLPRHLLRLYVLGQTLMKTFYF